MTDKPQIGDTIRWTVEGTVSATNPDGFYINGKYWYPNDAGRVSILEKAPDPAKDPVGTVRREEHEGGHSIWVREDPSHGDYYLCISSTAWGNIGARMEPEALRRTVITGSVPGTVAARLLPTPARELCGEGRKAIVERLARNQQIAAIKLYREITGCGLRESKDAVARIEAEEAARQS